MGQVKNQFERVQRAFAGVLNNRNQNLVEYEDNAWGFFLHCWHLKDWIKNDTKGVAKATREKIEIEVNSYPALVMVGDLANKSKHLKVTTSVTEADGTQRTQRTVSGFVHVDGEDGTHKSGQGTGGILLLVVDSNGDEFPVKKLATDAMKNWMAIIKKYRI